MRHEKLNVLLAILLLLVLPLAAGCAADGDDGTDDATMEDTAMEDEMANDDDYADRMATEHADDSPEPGFAAGGEGDMEGIETERVGYADMNGNVVEGYLARPAENSHGAPAIIVIHEWWGLNDNVETMARMLAQQGYQALAVDLYNGESADSPEGARELMSAVDEGTATRNLQQAHHYLTRRLGAEKVGVIGWCFGGAWSLQSAIALGEDLDAAVIYYGRLTSDETQLSKIEAPILGLFGSEDGGIPVSSVREFETALENLDKPASIHVYEGANHAFANPSGERYEPEAAKDAWEKTTAFLDEHLK